MISKQQQKFIKSLQIKKYRIQAQNFLVEGEKNVLELLGSYLKIVNLYVTENFLDQHSALIYKKAVDFMKVSQDDLQSVGALSTNDAALAVVEIPAPAPFKPDAGWIFGYENLQDPGNLGTILRISDWYNIKNVILSKGSVDVYSPKVVQASMGSLFRVAVHYIDLMEFVVSCGYPVYAATLEGKDIHACTFPSRGVFLFGNESKGLSPELLEKVHDRITIPRYGKAESLNVAIASAVFADNLFARLEK